MAKLYVNNNNQKSNFFKLLNCLEHKTDQYLRLHKDKILFYKTEFSKHFFLFNMIAKYRDQLFAHTEKLWSIHPTSEFFSEVEKVVDLSFNLLNESSLRNGKPLLRNYINVSSMV